MKRAGFLTSDGTPTELYKQFRNQSLRGAAAAEAMRHAYASLYTANEYVHDASERELKGLIVQVTGLEDGSKLIPAMLASFKTLTEYAEFNASGTTSVDPHGDDHGEEVANEGQPGAGDQQRNNIRLG